jgi:hypothetical protein
MTDPNLPYGLPWYCEDSSAEERADEDAWWEDLAATERPTDTLERG